MKVHNHPFRFLAIALISCFMLICSFIPSGALAAELHPQDNNTVLTTTNAQYVCCPRNNGYCHLPPCQPGEIRKKL